MTPSWAQECHCAGAQQASVETELLPHPLPPPSVHGAWAGWGSIWSRPLSRSPPPRLSPLELQTLALDLSHSSGPRLASFAAWMFWAVSISQGFLPFPSLTPPCSSPNPPAFCSSVNSGFDSERWLFSASLCSRISQGTKLWKLPPSGSLPRFTPPQSAFLPPLL